jgi:hypothetical protein
MVRACTSSDDVEPLVCDATNNASSLPRFLANQFAWRMQPRSWVAKHICLFN